MAISTKRLSIIAVAGLSLTGLAATAGMAANSGTGSSLQCGVATSTKSGMLAIEGTVLSPVALTGEYRFSIRSASSGGSSNINQGGMFTASANQVTPIGSVTVNAGANVDVEFTVTANGQTYDCSQSIADL